jgi:membrane protease YdiL (CAAX protease family)
MRSGFLESGVTDGIHVKHRSAYFITLFLVIAAYAIIGQIPLSIVISTNPDALEAYKFGNTSSLGLILGKNKLLLFLILPFVFSLLALLLSVRFIHEWPIRSLFTAAHRFDWKRFLLSFGIWASILTVFLILLKYYTGKVEWNYKPDTFLSLMVISLVFIPIQTTCEEVLFRSYLLKAFNRSIRKAWIAVMASGILFGLMHSANPEIEILGPVAMVYYVLTGIFLGVLAWKDNGIELSMGYHAVNNIFSSLILTNDWQAFQTDALFKDFNPPSLGWDSLITIFMVQPLLILVFGKIYGWKWKRSDQ